MSGLKISQQRRGNAHVQGFSPNRILSETTSLDTSNILAFSPGVDLTYTINNTGTQAIIPANTIRVVSDTTTSIDFTGTVVFEIMDM